MEILSSENIFIIAILKDLMSPGPDFKIFLNT